MRVFVMEFTSILSDLLGESENRKLFLNGGFSVVPLMYAILNDTK